MTFRVYLILAAITAAFFLYLSPLNDTFVSVKISGATTHEIKVIPLIFASFFSGFLLHFLISLIKSGKRFFENLRLSRGNKNIETATNLIEEAKKAGLLGNWEKSKELLNKSVSTSSHSVEPYIMLLDQHLQTGDHAGAASILDNIPSPFENNFELLMAKVRVFLSSGEIERAIYILKRVDEKEKTIEIKALLRDTYVQSGSWEEASKVQEEISKGLKKGKTKPAEEKISARISYEIARKMADEGNVEEAAKRLKELMKKWPESPPPYALLGNLYKESGKNDLAVETWKEGFLATKKMIFLFIVEENYLREEDPQSIIDLYNSLTIDDPNNSTLHLFFGKLYLRLEMIEEATDRLQKAEALEVNSPYISRLIGEANFRKGFFKEAAESFKTSLGFKRSIVIPFVCDSCGAQSAEWNGTCPSCDNWDGFRVDLAIKKNETA